MEENKTEKIMDSARSFFEKHELAVTLGFFGATIFLGYKIQEVCIRNAIRKANIETVEYILEQFRYVRH